MVDTMNARDSVDAALRLADEPQMPHTSAADTPAPAPSRPTVREWTEDVFVSRTSRYRKYRFRRD